MTSRLAVYLPAGPMISADKPFGRMVANQELYAALLHHGGYDRLDFLTQEPTTAQDLRAALGVQAGGPELTAVPIITSKAGAAARAAGTLLRGDPDFHGLAWERRRLGAETAYSLAGLVHTLGPSGMRQKIAQAVTAPTQAWDAIICTSPSVRQVLERMLDGHADFLAERFRGVPPARPQLPVIPLGVDAAALAALADRPAVRASRRGEYGLADDEILILWVGRLSFFEKAYPQPMFRAVQEAAHTSGKRVVFVMAGWFPNGEQDRAAYAEAARAYAPDVDVRFEDGTDRARLGELWAAADIFLSLVDNVQETFGLTPVEAMAAGLPVVASDWDGYRFTVRDGVDGFLIPTLGGPAGGIGEAIANPHVLQVETYQSYVGTLAQATAVDVGCAARALVDLIASPDLRRRMGAAGRARAAATFDWPVVVGQIKALFGDLAERRAAAGQPAASRHRLNPVNGDPFVDFAPFATAVLTPSTRLSVRPGAGADDIARAHDVALDRKAAYHRTPLPLTFQAFGLIARGEAATVAEVTARFAPDVQGAMQLTLLWLCKLGILEWKAG